MSRSLKDQHAAEHDSRPNEGAPHDATRAEFGRLLEDSLNEIYLFDAASLRYILASRGALDNLGYSMSELAGLTPLDLNSGFTPQSFGELIQPLETGDQRIVDFETIHRRKDGSFYPAEVSLHRSSFQEAPVYVAMALDIAQRRRTERELQGHKRVLEQLASGTSLKLVMEALVKVTEAMSPGMIGSVLILDRKTNRFVNVYAPSLPGFYNNAILGLEIGPEVGSCGTAAYTGKRVIVEDVMTHPYWAKYRDITRKVGIRACWSEPIVSSKGEVLGSFAMYYRDSRGPGDDDIKLIRTTAHIASLAIEQKQNEQEIKNAHASLEKRVQERTSELVAANQQLEAAMEDLESEKKLLRKLIDLQEQERRMVAHDIHDGFIQDVVGAHMHVLSINSERAPETIQAIAVQVAAILERAITEGRRLIREMRPMVLDQEGAIEAIQHLIADELAAGLFVAFDHDVRFDRLDPKLEGAVFRIVQEALTNVRKHAQTDHAAVQLKEHDGSLEVVVRDQGVGFDPNGVSAKRFGLRGIRERARLFDGTVEIESALNQGTMIRVQFPVQPGP